MALPSTLPAPQGIAVQPALSEAAQEAIKAALPFYAEVGIRDLQFSVDSSLANLAQDLLQTLLQSQSSG